MTSVSDSKYYSSTRFRPTCPSCGKRLGELEEPYKRLLEQGKSPKEAADTLGILNPCCRTRVFWPIVLPIGGFYLPKQEATMLNYLGLKPMPPMPSMAILSLKRAVTGELYIVSHVTKNGTVGSARMSAHEPQEMELANEYNDTCSVRVRTDPGEISLAWPYETRTYRRDIIVDRVRSYFDVPEEGLQTGEYSCNMGPQENITNMENDEPLIAITTMPSPEE